MTDETNDTEGGLLEKGPPSFALQWYSAHLGPAIEDLFASNHVEHFTPNKGGTRAKKVHFTVVNPNTPRARVVIVNSKDLRVFRIITPEAALSLIPLEWRRPTVAEHQELNALISKPVVARLLA